MPDIIIETTPAPILINDETSSADLRAAMRATRSEPEAQPETPEPKTEEPVETKPETESGTVEKKQEPEEVDEELPEGVKKRIAQEAKKQAFFQSKIDRAVSDRKAKEAEAQKLPGAEPVQNTEQPSNGRPVRPKPDAFTTWGEYLTADENYATEHEAWLVTETRKTVAQEFTANQEREEGRRKWDTALKDHAELPQMAPQVIENSPEGLQVAISALDNWAGVTVHLGKNPGELAALVQQFKANPHRAVAELGKLEDRLKPAPKQAAAAPDKPLPKPLAPVGGGASASTPKVDMENAPFSAFKSEVRRALKPTG